MNITLWTIVATIHLGATPPSEVAFGATDDKASCEQRVAEIRSGPPAAISKAATSIEYECRSFEAKLPEVFATDALRPDLLLRKPQP